MTVPFDSMLNEHAAACRCGMRDWVDHAMSPARLAKLKFWAPTTKLSCAAKASSTLCEVSRPTKNASSFETSCPV